MSLSSLTHNIPFGPGPKLAHVSGFGQIAPPDLANQASAAALGALSITGAVTYGALIGGVACKSWDGAGSGALISGSISAGGYGLFFLLSRAWVAGALLLALSAGGAYWTYKRW